MPAFDGALIPVAKAFGAQRPLRGGVSVGPVAGRFLKP